MTDPDEPGDLPPRVSTLELFFDLVFVFAITQLTGILSHDVTVEDGFWVLLVFGALWWMYGGYGRAGRRAAGGRLGGPGGRPPGGQH